LSDELALYPGFDRVGALATPAPVFTKPAATILDPLSAIAGERFSS
jgi:hypothetical protein